MKEPVKAIVVQSIELLYDSVMPGTVFFPEDGRYIWAVCPCGCGAHMRLPLFKSGEPKPGDRPTWEWNGNRDVPTLAPSIRDVGTCYFHGHLREGVWTFEGDSGVKST